jgi:hypothetical protein
MTPDMPEGRPPQATSRDIITPPQGADGAILAGRGPRAVRASVYAPCAGRTWWWLAYLCAHCGAGHLGRSRTEAEIPGIRRSRCGHLVDVVVARTYRGWEAA